MSTFSTINELRCLAHDTECLASNHPHMNLARSSMNVVEFSGKADTNAWIDDVFANVEVILSDISKIEQP